MWRNLLLKVKRNNMDYGNILQRALEISYKHKFLWVFAFFIGGITTYNFNFPNFGLFSPENADYATINNLRSWYFQHEILIISLAIIVAILFLLIWIFSIASQGAIIAGVDTVTNNKATGFRQACQIGFRNFWRLLGLGVVIGLFYLLVIGILTVPIIICAVTGLIWLAIILAILFFMLFIVILFVSALSFNFSYRYLIIKKSSIFNSISYGYKFFKIHFIEILILALILFGIGVVWLIINTVILMTIFLILASIGVLLYFISKATLVYSIIIGLIILSIISLILTTFYNTFHSSVWTISYKELLTKKANKI